MGAERRSVSAAQELFAEADARAADLGYSNFSQYIQALIRADILQRTAHMREAASTAEQREAARKLQSTANLSYLKSRRYKKPGTP